MEDSKIQKSLEHYFLPRHEYQEDKNDMFAHFNKKIDENKDKIIEVDKKHTQNFYELQRSIDAFGGTVKTLDSSVQSLDNTIMTLSEEFKKDREDMRNIIGRVDAAEKVIKDTQTLKEQRKLELIKFASIVISSLLGAGGLISWLGPLLFSGK